MTCETNCFGDANLQLIDFSKEDDYLIAFPFRDSLKDLRLSVSFDNVNERINLTQSELVDTRRHSFLRKSLAWDSAFFTSAGMLNPEELFMINKGFKNAESNHAPPRTRKDSAKSKAATNIGRTTNELSCKKMDICSQNKVKSVRGVKSQSQSQILQGTHGMTRTGITTHQKIQDNVPSLPKLFSSRRTNNNAAAVEGSDNVKLENKARKAATSQGLIVSKRSRAEELSGFPRLTAFTPRTTKKNSKVDGAYGSSSSASSSKNLSKSVKRKVNPKNMKLINSPSSVQHPLSSTCSSSTSPASSIDGWLLESSSSTITTYQNTTPVTDFPSQNYGERKFIRQNATRSSIGTGPFSGGPRRKLKSSGLRMPSPTIGFFDEEPIFEQSVQDRFQSYNLSPTASCLKAGRKVGSSCSKLRSKEILKINLDRKRRKGLVEAEKENVCSFEDQVNGLSRQLEVVDLEKDLVQAKTATEHITPCLSKLKFCKL